MSEKDWENFDKALFEAWLFAINSVGMDEFKKASFFGSNLKPEPINLLETNKKPIKAPAKATAA